LTEVELAKPVTELWIKIRFELKTVNK